MQDMHELLSREPMTFNELLDMFEAYVSTIGGPLTKANHLIGDELHYQGGDIFFHITGTVDNADDMAKRLGRIRAARNTGTDVSFTLTRVDAAVLETCIREVVRAVESAASVFHMLHGREWSGDEDNETESVLYLAYRALDETGDQECTNLRHFARKLGEAVRVQSINGEEAA